MPAENEIRGNEGADFDLDQASSTIAIVSDYSRLRRGSRNDSGRPHQGRYLETGLVPQNAVRQRDPDSGSTTSELSSDREAHPNPTLTALVGCALPRSHRVRAGRKSPRA